MCPHPFTVITLALLGFSSGAMAQKKTFKPNLGPNLPRITVHAGDVSLLLRQTSQWTPGRIDYRKIPMTTERSFYGTVFMFPEIGFIGTGHLENEPENLQSLHFFVDGKEIKTPGETIEADQSFKFHRTSKIRDFDLETTIEIHDNKLYETATIHAHKDVPLKLVYHFMHAWKPEISEFCTHVGGQTVSGKLNDLEENHRKFFINKPASWTAVFDPTSNQFAISKILASPGGDAAAHSSKIWNVPDTYRKYYLTSFSNETVPTGFSGTWKMVTGFGKSIPENWKKNAEIKARQLFDDPLVKPKGFKFTAMGCGPYTPEAEAALAKQLKWENENPNSDFIIHCGDIVTGKVKDWPEAQYQKIADLLKTNNKIPTFIVPGDNEWNDQEDPDRHWGYWEKHFLHFDKHWPTIPGSSPVERQDIRPENFAFTKDEVLFIGINKVGGMVHDSAEWETRLAQNIDWIRERLMSQRDKTHSAVIFAQASGFSKIGDFQKKLTKIGSEYGKPILYLHADGHKWTVEPEKYGHNITRVMLDVVNGQFPPVQVTVTGDPVTPFHYDRRLRFSGTE
jgi:hypothetical protein